MNNDLISREALKEEFNNMASEAPLGGMELIPICSIISFIDNAPTVPLPDFKAGYKQAIIDGKTNFSRQQGEWIIVKDEKYGDYVKCPFCGKELAGTDLNFCCKCGADMKEGGAE